MKRVAFFSVACAAFLILGCSDINTLKNLSDNTPESISLKTSGTTYELPLGTYSLSLADQIDTEKIHTEITKGSAEGISVYEYQPTGSEVLQYILDYRIANIPLSVNSDSNIKEITFDTTFTAPDFTNSISDSLKIDGQEFGPINEPGNSADALSLDSVLPGGASIYFNFTSPTFSEMLIRSGTMDITFALPEGEEIGDGYEMNVTVTLADENEVPLTNKNGEQVKSAETNVAGGGTVSVTLDGATVAQHIRILVSGSVKGGDVTKSHTYTVSMAPQNIKLEKITGLYMSNEELGEKGRIPIKQEFALSGMNPSLKQATISKGALSFSCEYPGEGNDKWSGIICEDTNFVLRGALELNETDFKTVDDPDYIVYQKSVLDGKTVSPGSVKTFDSDDAEKYSYLDVSLENATIVFAPEGKETSITLAGSCTIDDLSNLIIDISLLGDLGGDEPKSIETGLTFSSLLGGLTGNEDGDNEDLSNLIKDIEFSGITGYLFMTYPIEDESLKNLKFAADINATYDGCTEPYSLIGDEPEDSELSMKNTTNTLALLADENSIIGPAGEEFMKTYSTKEIKTLDGLINQKPDNLVINYSLGLSGNADEVELSGKVLEAISDGTASIDLSIAIVLPLQLKLVDNYDIPYNAEKCGEKSDKKITIDNAMKLAGTEIDKDLLNRDDANDSSDFEKYADIIKSMTLHYTVQNDTDLNMSVVLTDDNVFTGNKAKTLNITGKEEEIKLTHDEIMDIFNSENYPFIPKIAVEIATEKEDGTAADPVKIRRDATFGVKNVYFTVVADGTVSLWNKNDEDKDK